MHFDVAITYAGAQIVCRISDSFFYTYLDVRAKSNLSLTVKQPRKDLDSYLACVYINSVSTVHFVVVGIYWEILC